MTCHQADNSQQVVCPQKELASSTPMAMQAKNPKGVFPQSWEEEN